MFRIAFPGRRLSLPLLALSLMFPGTAPAAEPVTRAQVTLVDLAADASRSAPNDLARASAYFEAQDANAGELARRVNRAIAGGLQTAKSYPAVKAQSGTTSTSPVYSKNGRTIEAWRMRSGLLLESRDTAALSELLGKLQATLAIGQLTLQPAPETRKKAEDDATLDAIAAFQARATLIAKAMNKSFRVRQMAINAGGGGRPPVYMMEQSKMMSAAAEPMPVEAGDTMLTVNITGQIELPVE